MLEKTEVSPVPKEIIGRAMKEDIKKDRDGSFDCDKWLVVKSYVVAMADETFVKIRNTLKSDI